MYHTFDGRVHQSIIIGPHKFVLNIFFFKYDKTRKITRLLIFILHPALLECCLEKFPYFRFLFNTYFFGFLVCSGVFEHLARFAENIFTAKAGYTTLAANY